MRVMGFSKQWEKLEGNTFTTTRFTRKDKDWQAGELVQIVIHPRSKERKILGFARIVNKERRDLFRVGLSDYEIHADGFNDKEQLGEWLMAKSWRPEGWTTETVKTNPLHCLAPQECADHFFEAGADAILETQKKKLDELLFVLFDLREKDISVNTAHERICHIFWGGEEQ